MQTKYLNEVTTINISEMREIKLTLMKSFLALEDTIL